MVKKINLNEISSIQGKSVIFLKASLLKDKLAFRVGYFAN